MRRGKKWLRGCIREQSADLMSLAANFKEVTSQTSHTNRLREQLSWWECLSGAIRVSHQHVITLIDAACSLQAGLERVCGLHWRASERNPKIYTTCQVAKLLVDFGGGQLRYGRDCRFKKRLGETGLEKNQRCGQVVAEVARLADQWTRETDSMRLNINCSRRRRRRTMQRKYNNDRVMLRCLLWKWLMR